MKNHGLSIKLLTAFIIAAAVLGATAAISAAFTGRSWDSYTLAAQTRAADTASASKAAQNIRSADSNILAAFAVRDIATAKEYIAAAREILSGIEEDSAENKYLCGSESINAVAEASKELDSISEMISEGDFPRAGRIYFNEYQPKLRSAAEYAERVSEKLSSESRDPERIGVMRSRSQRLTAGIALLGISVILFFGLYIDLLLRREAKPIPEPEPKSDEPPQTDKYETETEYDGIKFLSDRLSESENVINMLVNSINTLAEGDPDAAGDGPYPDNYANALSAVRKMKARLRFISSQISRAAEFVAAESVRVSDNAEELSTAAEKQSSAAVSLSVCTEKIKGLIAKSADISERIRTDGEECHAAAEGCSQRLEEASVSVDTLRKSIEELNSLAESAAEIATQANLLAVSTAVHASKGECSGASLAAAADEARSLAIRSEALSAEALRINEDCGSAVFSAVTGVENAISSSLELEGSFREISRNAEEMNALNGEQSRAAADTEEYLAKITDFVHLSKNAYEEYAASGRMLIEQTAALRKIMPVKKEDLNL